RPVLDNAGNPLGDVLIAGTFGRGAYKLRDVQDLLARPDVLSITSDPSPDVSGVMATPQTGTGALTPGAAYRYKLVFATAAGQESEASAEITARLGATDHRVGFNIPRDPTGAATQWRLYRTAANGQVYKLLDTQAYPANDPVTYTDLKADAAL